MNKINTTQLLREIEWLKSIVERRMNIALEKTHTIAGSIEKKRYTGIEDLVPPMLDSSDSKFASLVYEYELTMENRLLLIMSLVNHLQPDFFDRLILANLDYVAAQKEATRYGTRFNELGGISGDHFRGFIPTGLTWLFLLAGSDVKKRIEILTGMNRHNILLKKEIISFSNVSEHEPILSGAINIDHTWLRYLSIGDVEKPVIEERTEMEATK